jgi:NAD-dependent deacetylase
MSHSDTLDDKAQRSAAALNTAQTCFAFVGAGLSVESGIPTYRGEDGLFSDPETERLAFASTLNEQPQKVLEWFQSLRHKLSGVQPNDGHHALAEIHRTTPIIAATQNIDGLIEEACLNQQVQMAVHHLHGRADRDRCHDCGQSHEPADLSEMPRCDACGGLIRPDVVLFGEMLPQDAFDQALQAARDADVCLLLGTSGIVHPAAQLPHEAAKRGAHIIEVNPESTELSDLADICIRESTGTALPAIASRLAGMAS